MTNNVPKMPMSGTQYSPSIVLSPEVTPARSVSANVGMMLRLKNKNFPRALNQLHTGFYHPPHYSHKLTYQHPNN